MTTPFDQQPQPVPPSEGTNDAPEDRANAPTVPNTVPAGQPNVASDGATTTPMTPATASQRPAGAPFDRVYAVSPQQLFQVIHDQLTTGATFTLDNENTQTGAFSFHSYDGVNCTLTVVPQGAAGAAIRLEATGNESAKRVDEFLAALDKRIGVAPAPATHGAGAATGFAGAAAPAVLAPNAQGVKKTSKLAVFAIIWGVLFVLAQFVDVSGRSWGGLLFATVIPALLSGFAVYVTRPSGKVQGRVLAWVAVGITVVGLVIGGVFVIRDDAKAKADRAELEASLATKCEAYSWPESDIAALLPQPKSTKGEIRSESSDYFSIEVCGTDAKQYADYVKSVQDNGFTVDYSKSADSFNAKNADGYSVSVSRNTDDETIMSITIQVPEKKEDTSTDGDAAKQDDKSTHTGTDSSDANKQSDQSSDQKAQQNTNDSADFKATMDSYEAFIDEYVAFMNKYQKSDNVVSMATDYAGMMKRYSEFSQKVDAIDENSLSSEDSAYYTEVMTRCAQKLASVGQ